MTPDFGEAFLLLCGPGATLDSGKGKGFNFVVAASGTT